MGYPQIIQVMRPNHGDFRSPHSFEISKPLEDWTTICSNDNVTTVPSNIYQHLLTIIWISIYIPYIFPYIHIISINFPYFLVNKTIHPGFPRGPPAGVSWRATATGADPRPGGGRAPDRFGHGTRRFHQRMGFQWVQTWDETPSIFWTSNWT